MSTIDELIAEVTGVKFKFVQNGSFKVKRSDWEEVYYYLPYFKNVSGYWHGVDSDGNSRCISVDNNQFKIYEKPKKKVNRCLWFHETGVVHCLNSEKPPGVNWTKIPGIEVEI